MGQLIVVPSLEPVSGPLVFLAGPIQGASDWQTEAIRTINFLDPGLAVASPRSPPPWHGDFGRQTAWEHRYLERACRGGCVLFWLPKEEAHDCSRCYAQTTRFELGWHFALSLAGKAKLVVGIEPGFTGERYLHATLPMLAPDIPLCANLPDTCANAVILARGH